MHSFPKGLRERLQKLLGEEYEPFVAALSHPIPRSLRFHPIKVPVRYDFDLVRAVPWCPRAYYLEGDHSFGEDPLWYAGAYYVQTASSMAIAPFVQWFYQSHGEGQPLFLLDFAAAPGGKTTLLLDLVGTDGVVVANEPHPQRIHILLENVTRWGYPNCIVTQAPPKLWEEASISFDLVLVDAPCSGEGLWRRSGFTSWSPGWIKKCAMRQRHILATAVSLLKTNGMLLYATCTYEQEENEDQVAWLATHWEWEAPSFSPPQEWQWTPSEVANHLLAYRLYPHRVEGEGFFFAPLMFKSVSAYRKGRTRSIASYLTVPSLPFLQPGLFYARWEHYLILTTEPTLQLALALKEKGIPIRQVGIPLYDFHYDTLLPHAFFSISSPLTLSVVELSYDEALGYLRGELSFLSEKTGGDENMYMAVAYRGVNLGGLKRVGKRYRSLLPKMWSARHYLR